MKEQDLYKEKKKNMLFYHSLMCILNVQVIVLVIRYHLGNTINELITIVTKNGYLIVISTSFLLQHVLKQQYGFFNILIYIHRHVDVCFTC